MTNQSEAHLLLKQIGERILLKNGFKPSEISQEYYINTPDGTFIVDVVGISKHKTYFIECGIINNKEKFNLLSGYCDKIIHLPYVPGARPGIGRASKSTYIFDLIRVLEKNKSKKSE